MVTIAWKGLKTSTRTFSRNSVCMCYGSLDLFAVLTSHCAQPLFHREWQTFMLFYDFTRLAGDAEYTLVLFMKTSQNEISECVLGARTSSYIWP